MDVARLNFSHGEHAEHGRRFHEVRQAAEAAGRNVADARRPAGPEDPARPLRRRAGHVGDRRAGPHHRRGLSRATTTACRRPTSSSPTTCGPATGCSSTTATSALVAVEVENGTDVVCDVTEGGPVSNNKGLSLPGVAVSVPALSEKDAEDLEFALRLGRRLRRAVVRPRARGRQAGAPGDGRGRHPSPGDRQDREARGRRAAGRDRARLRRRRWWPAATSAWRCRSRRCRSCRSASSRPAATTPSR